MGGVSRDPAEGQAIYGGTHQAGEQGVVAELSDQVFAPAGSAVASSAAAPQMLLGFCETAAPGSCRHQVQEVLALIRSRGHDRNATS